MRKLLLLVTILCSSISGFAQGNTAETVITAEEWNKAVRIGFQKIDSPSVGALEITRRFSNGILKSTLTHQRLYRSPDRTWTLDIEEDDANKRRTEEYVKIGDREFIKINSGKWRKTVRYPTMVSVADDVPRVEKTPVFRKSGETMNGKQYHVFIRELGYLREGKTTTIIERNWISPEGVLWRTEKMNRITANEIIEMEHSEIVDYGIPDEGKIEAKMKEAKSKK